MGLTRVTKHVAEFFVLAKPICLFLSQCSKQQQWSQEVNNLCSQSVSQSISQLVQSPIFLRVDFLYKTVGVMIPSNKVWWPSSDRKGKKNRIDCRYKNCTRAQSIPSCPPSLFDRLLSSRSIVRKKNTHSKIQNKTKQNFVLKFKEVLY